MPHRKEIGLFRKRGLDKAQEIHYNSQVNRGVAKFGIALGSGPRGLGFESRHSDQIAANGMPSAAILYHYAAAEEWGIRNGQIFCIAR